jgi:FtsP/CotA-like multicopper oxidase with cupredoxin domain
LLTSYTGHFPGPTIEARSGDAVEVTVTNGIAGNADSGLAIHWHGMLMKGEMGFLLFRRPDVNQSVGANEMDGVVGVTQCIVSQGQTFTYKFQIDEEQHGTFWYHSHSAVQRADGLYGGLVVHRPVNLEAQSDLSLYEYDRERLLLVGDWYHWTAGNVLDGYKNFRNFAYEVSKIAACVLTRV